MSRHPSFPFTLQPMMGDRRHISRYEGPDHIPYVMRSPLTLEDCQPFLGSDAGPVTFTVAVPFAEVMAGPAALEKYVTAAAFDIAVSLESCEYRPVGAVIDEFDQEYAGHVLLQVTCGIQEA